MPIVTFNVDLYPHCKGDVVKLSEDDLKAVDAVAKKRGVTAYETVGKQELKPVEKAKQTRKVEPKK